MKQAYLLTGSPGVGKTTIIKEVLSRVEASAGGFYTEEIKHQGLRQGFRIVTLNGKSATLAHINIRSPYRVSKYGVDVSSLDEVGVSALRQATLDCDIVVIDEIGRMELFSSSFRQAVLGALESGKSLLGTIMLSSHPWADMIKRHPKVALLSVTRMNRSEVAEQVLTWLRLRQERKEIAMDRTLVLIKPDALQRGLAGTVISRLEKQGLKIVAMKMLQMDHVLAKQLYAVHLGKPFFEELVAYMTSSPIITAIFEGEGAVQLVRMAMGDTDPARAEPGTIRGDFGLGITHNAIHGADSVENAAREMGLFFSTRDVLSYPRQTNNPITES